MATSGTQISPLHLAMAAAGGVLIYAALQDMTPLEALRELTSGKKPRAVEPKGSTLRGSVDPASYLGGGAGGGSGHPLVAAAERYLGVPYRWGGTSRSGLDCSGLVVVAFQDAYGVTPPRTTYGQEAWGQLTRVSREDLRPGDLVFWPGHVAIYAGGGEVIHAPGTGKKVRRAPVEQAGPTRNPSSYRRYKGGSSRERAVMV